MDCPDLKPGVIRASEGDQNRFAEAIFVLWKATAVPPGSKVRDACVEYVTRTTDVHGLQRGCQWNHRRAQGQSLTDIRHHGDPLLNYNSVTFVNSFRACEG